VIFICIGITFYSVKRLNYICIIVNLFLKYWKYCNNYLIVASAENRDHGRVGYLREDGKYCELEMRDHTIFRRAGLHLLVPRQWASSQLRPQSQGHPDGACGYWYHSWDTGHLQRSTRRLGQLYLQPVQSGLCIRTSSRAQW